MANGIDLSELFTQDDASLPRSDMIRGNRSESQGPILEWSVVAVGAKSRRKLEMDMKRLPTRTILPCTAEPGKLIPKTPIWLQSHTLRVQDENGHTTTQRASIANGDCFAFVLVPVRENIRHNKVRHIPPTDDV